MTKPMAIKTEYLIQPAEVFPMAWSTFAWKFHCIKEGNNWLTNDFVPLLYPPNRFNWKLEKEVSSRGKPPWMRSKLDLLFYRNSLLFKFPLPLFLCLWLSRCCHSLKRKYEKWNMNDLKYKRMNEFVFVCICEWINYFFAFIGGK